MTKEVWVAAYCRYGTDLGADRETMEIISSLDERGYKYRAFGISNELSLINQNIFAPIFGRWRASFFDKFNFFLKHGSRIFNESMIDNFILKRLDQPIKLLSSCYTPRSFKKNRALGGENIFYAKNSFDFYQVIIQESNKWGIPPKPGEKKYLSMYNNMINNTDKFCVLSESDPVWLQSMGINQSNIFMLPMGVSYLDFKETYDHNCHKLNSTKILSNPIWGCMAGSILRKGIPFVISSWLNATKKNGHLMIVGISAEDRKKLISKFNLSESSKIIFKNHVNKYDFFQSIDYFLSPSIAEGQPRAALECIAAGVTLVASERGSSAVPGEFYTSVDPNNISKMIKIFENPPVIIKSKIDNARNYVKFERKFTSFGDSISDIIS